jgi:hypothetical protein
MLVYDSVLDVNINFYTCQHVYYISRKYLFLCITLLSKISLIINPELNFTYPFILAYDRYRSPIFDEAGTLQVSVGEMSRGP